jgi:hypothetical protein
LKGKPFTLYPDFMTQGIADVSNYNDGLRRRVLLRLKHFGDYPEFSIQYILIKPIRWYQIKKKEDGHEM